jgi:uncharacterized damage-inducible protein DinB
MAQYDESLFVSTERQLLERMVDVQRSEIAGILEGLSEEEARARLVPSLTTPLGLVKHAVFVEKVWFHSRVAGVDRHALGLPDDIDDSFRLTDADTIGSVTADFAAACAHSRTVVDEHDLDEQFPWRLGPVTLRFVLTHVVQEYARHAGQGDILAEQLVARR